MNEFERYVYEVLQKKYKSPEWIVLPQVRTQTGYSIPTGGERIIDFFIINTFPSKDFKCIAIEAKKTIDDYRTDRDNVRKQLAARFYSDEFYYIFPAELFSKYERELLGDWKKLQDSGIMVINEGNIRKVKYCHGTKNPFPMGFICSLLRQALKY